MIEIARALIVMGALIVLVGLVLLVVGRIPFLGHLPGDIRIQTGGTTWYIPLATSILISIVLSLLLTIIGNLFLRR